MQVARVTVGQLGIDFLGDRSSGKGSVTTLADHILRPEKRFHKSGRALPPAGP